MFAAVLSNFADVIGIIDCVNEYIFAAVLAAYLPNDFCLLEGLFGIYFMIVAAICTALLSSIIGLITGLFGYAVAPQFDAFTTHNNNFIQAPGGAYTIHNSRPSRRSRAIIGIIGGYFDGFNVFSLGVLSVTAVTVTTVGFENIVEGVSTPPQVAWTTITVEIGFGYGFEYEFPNGVLPATKSNDIGGLFDTPFAAENEKEKQKEQIKRKGKTKEK